MTLTDQPTLRFHIVEGRQLPPKDFNGKADPYIIVKMSKLKAKSSIVRNSLCPTWDEVLELSPDFTEVPTLVQVSCWDKDPLSSNFMGVVKIDPKTLFESDGSPKMAGQGCASWYPLQKRRGSDKVGGELYMQVGFHVNHDDQLQVLRDYHQALTGLGADSGLSAEEASLQGGGLLYIDIVSASDLPWKRDAILKTSFDMDPFVVASLGEITFKTSTVRHNRNPKWNERIVFRIDPELNSYSLKLSVYDHDKFSHNDFVGTASVPIANILAAYSAGEGGKLMSLPLNLDPTTPKDLFLSKLLIRANYVPHPQARLDFWSALASRYDANETGNMDRTEILTMLDSLGASVDESTVSDFFQRHGKSPETDELTFQELSTCLEDLTAQGETGVEAAFDLKVCPICSRKLSACDLDAVSHIAVCASNDPDENNHIVMGNFITEANAQRKWFAKIASFVSFGQYKLGHNNGNILVQDRASGEILEERMPTYIKLGIRLLYRISRTPAELKRVKKILYTMSVKQGNKYTDPNSRRSIQPFINFHRLNEEEILEPIDSFPNFNEFFYRKLKPGARCLGSEDPRVAVSPADSRVMVFPTVSAAQELWIKGQRFTIARLFNNLLSSEEVAAYEAGSLAIFRLAPQDYHRFHIPVDGILSPPTNIDGQYYTVNPMAIRSSLDVYGENKRCFSFIDSAHHGRVAVVCIGAMLVGSIILTSTPGSHVSRLDEHGYFAFGGSTILVLFPKNAIAFDKDLVKNSEKKLETLLRVGNTIGTAPL